MSNRSVANRHTHGQTYNGVIVISTATAELQNTRANMAMWNTCDLCLIIDVDMYVT